VISLTIEDTTDNTAQVLKWDESTPLEAITIPARTVFQNIAQHDLSPETWQLESREVLQLLEKLRNAGKSLGEYVNGRFYYGIKTGLNEAFLVYRATRDRLIREH